MKKRRKATEQYPGLAKRANDPVWQQHLADKEKNRLERRKRFTEICAPILQELSECGLDVEDDLLVTAQKNAPLPMNAVEVLLRYLPKISEPRIVESIVRALSAAESQFDGRPLKACFEETSCEGVKFAIMNAIACTYPHSIDDWIDELLEHHYWGEKLRNLGYKEGMSHKLADLRDQLAGLAVEVGDVFGLSLDYSVRSVEDVEKILGLVHRDYKRTGDPDGLEGTALNFGAYILKVIEANFETEEWRRDHPQLGARAFPYRWRDGEIFPSSWCRKRIFNGPAHNVWSKFKALLVIDQVP